MTNADLYSPLSGLWADLQDLRVLRELAVLAAGLAAAVWVNRRIARRLAAADEARRFALAGLSRLQFPLTALAVVLVGRALLQRGQGVALLDIAVALLTALALVQAALYALRRAFAPSGRLRASERALAWAVWAGFALYVAGLAPAVLGALDAIGVSVGSHRVTALLALQAALTLGVAVLAALWAGRALEARLMRAEALDPNLRVMGAKLARAVLAVVALLVALPAVGIDVTVLSVFGGALGVGIGIGLQRIAANYVSGFIILMDRSVKIGDIVTIDRYTGELVRLTARYVVVRAADGTEALIPNETLVSSPVVNHCYSDRRVRLALAVHVAYGSDLERAARILEEAALRQPGVLREPAPAVLVKQLGERGVEFELGVWVEDSQPGQAALRSQLYRHILRGLEAAGIELPGPHSEARARAEERAAP